MVDNGYNNQNGLSKEQKTGLVLLTAFAVFALGLGILQIRNTMYSRFALNNQIPNDLKDKVNTVDALRFRDTDQDGLTDYDEIYVYGTSPYLSDTDSDGILDGEEVKKGTNPSCAEGSNCAFMSDQAIFVTSPSGTVGAVLNPDTILPTAPVAPEDFESMLKDPKKVRELLAKQKSVDPKVLENISDQELMDMVNKALDSSGYEQNQSSTKNNFSTSSVQ